MLNKKPSLLTAGAYVTKMQKRTFSWNLKDSGLSLFCHQKVTLSDLLSSLIPLQRIIKIRSNNMCETLKILSKC